MKINFFSGTHKDIIKQNTQSLAENKNQINIMSLNLAHGRANGIHQLFQTKKSIEKNLFRVSQVVKDNKIDVLCLQEVDSISFWSGKFNHTQFLSSLTNLPNFVQGLHVKGLNLAYGTAILTDNAFINSKTYAFKAVPPLFTKGFVSGSIELNNKTIDIVSLHFDFARKNVRIAQANYVIELFKNRKNSLIICGDFNTDINSKDRVIKNIIKELNLKAYKKDENLFTFNLTKKRIDWILISKDLDFLSYNTIDKNLSDHFGVCAKISL